MHYVNATTNKILRLGGKVKTKKAVGDGESLLYYGECTRKPGINAIVPSHQCFAVGPKVC